MEDIINQVKALQTADDTALAAIVSALEAVPATPVADPIVSVTLTTQAGVTTTFVPQA